MAILTDQTISADPLRIGCNEGVRRFKAHQLVLSPKFKWNQKIFIDFSETADKREDFPKDDPGKVPAGFIDNQTGDSDCVDFRMTDERIEQRYRSRFLSNSKGEKVLVAIEDAVQPFLPRVPLGSSGESE